MKIHSSNYWTNSAEDQQNSNFRTLALEMEKSLAITYVYGDFFFTFGLTNFYKKAKKQNRPIFKEKHFWLICWLDSFTNQNNPYFWDWQNLDAMMSSWEDDGSYCYLYAQMNY